MIPKRIRIIQRV